MHFLGIMGKEKYDILKETRVGVPNPSGVSETFGYTAVEMQMMGCLCTTKRCPGYLDTVLNTGILYDNEDNLAKCIIELLKRDENDIDNSLCTIRKKFSFDIVVNDWVNLFHSVKFEKGRIHPKSSRNLSYRCKWLKDTLRYCKLRVPFLNRLPLVDIVLMKLHL